jgi:hypothetical protein
VLLIFHRERQRERERDHGWTSSSRSTTTTSLFVIINFRCCTHLTGRLELCQKDSSFFFPPFGKRVPTPIAVAGALVGSILFFFQGEYFCRHDDDLMIFCSLIADLGCSKFPTRLKGFHHMGNED